MNVRLRMYQLLLFKFRRHLCKGSIAERFIALPSVYFFYFLTARRRRAVLAGGSVFLNRAA